MIGASMRLFVFRIVAPPGTRKPEDVAGRLADQGLPDVNVWQDAERPEWLNIDVRYKASSLEVAVREVTKRVRLVCGAATGPTSVAMEFAEIDEEDFASITAIQPD